MNIWFILLSSLLTVNMTHAGLSVFAAAGTAPAMKEIAADYTRRTGTAVVFNFANSGILARQIAAGADFDLFFSANEKWMNYIERKGLINPATRTSLLSTDMVIVVPEGASTDFNLSAPEIGRLAVGDQATPIGIYTKQAFTRLGCWDALQPHLCVGDTVNKVLNYVALGEADAGVVFRSVAFYASNRVDIVETVPPELHAPIRFPVAASTADAPGSQDFIAFLQSPYATSTFRKYGWTPCIIKK
ncbi:molybdate ABC transporter substrate-binding protein [Verrucomicrobia bacterium S94]|nr:molybdate ABC transporter substrate-binding protein [Verrucomicrobia bacterium S94]